MLFQMAPKKISCGNLFYHAYVSKHKPACSEHSNFLKLASAKSTSAHTTAANGGLWVRINKGSHVQYQFAHVHLNIR
jgi:hypothetical protein